MTVIALVVPETLLKLYPAPSLVAVLIVCLVPQATAVPDGVLTETPVTQSKSMLAPKAF